MQRNSRYRAVSITGIPQQFGNVTNVALLGPEVLFTFPSPGAVVPSLNDTCVNAVVGGAPRQCAPGELLTGISCNDANCGRPASLPEGAPFFLPVDLLNATQLLGTGLGLPAARLLAGENPSLTSEELVHQQVRPNFRQSRPFASC
jgi:hypothetical protein